MMLEAARAHSESIAQNVFYERSCFSFFAIGRLPYHTYLVNPLNPLDQSLQVVPALQMDQSLQVVPALQVDQTHQEGPQCQVNPLNPLGQSLQMVPVNYSLVTVYSLSICFMGQL